MSREFLFDGAGQKCFSFIFSDGNLGWKRDRYAVEIALERNDGSIICHNENFCLHRIGGPAIIWANGRKEWWVDGERQSDPLA